MRKGLSILLRISVVDFVFNLLWENLQAPLYQGYSNFRQHVPICFAAALGDMMVILFLYLLFAAMGKDILWIKDINMTDTAILVIAGMLIATGIEKRALIIGRWHYTSAMPLVPYLEVGLLPVIQMMLLPLLTFYCTKILWRTIKSSSL